MIKIYRKQQKANRQIVVILKYLLPYCLYLMRQPLLYFLLKIPHMQVDSYRGPNDYLLYPISFRCSIAMLAFGFPFDCIIKVSIT
jgi:hypothetical protein